MYSAAAATSTALVKAHAHHHRHLICAWCVFSVIVMNLSAAQTRASMCIHMYGVHAPTPQAVLADKAILQAVKRRIRRKRFYFYTSEPIPSHSPGVVTSPPLQKSGLAF